MYNETTDTVPLEINYIYRPVLWSERMLFNDLEISPGQEFGVEDMSVISRAVDFSKFTYQLGNIVCVKDTFRTNRRLSCGDDFQSFPTEKMCIYDLDKHGNLEDCRSMGHLSNCGCTVLINYKILRNV
ncbi:uncharacterized protein LOC128551752 [Mercenaria mercenaria]|uniref:uncharacterized protein LOC128551752 n=1 Tax=Mercenaria mercenaria TaxID=6596 RepID=UPI00234EE5E5|nr:uncharacterized protein LOC128551752 [Mercenaria mercenaria]